MAEDSRDSFLAMMGACGYVRPGCDQEMVVHKEGGCGELQKCDSSSSGCETRPVKATARQAGSKPCDGSGNATGDA
jgi:hypothetical protein